MNLLLALVITLVPVALTEPKLKYVSRGEGACRYEITNPLLYTVAVTIDCGAEYQPYTLNVSPRTREALCIKDSGAGQGENIVVCAISSWKRAVAGK